MAVVADKVVVELQAKIAAYEANIARAQTKFATAMTSIDRNAKRVSAGVGSAFAKIGLGFASAGLIRGATQLIDASTRITNSLKVAGLEGEQLKGVYDDLFASAQRNAAPISALATLYGRAAQAQKELGATSSELVTFTDNIAKALRVSGSTAEQAQGALLQLGQALGSARVMAEEFNSINEGARPILQAAAAGIEEAAGSVAKLKQLVNDGKVSNRAFFDGIQAGAYILDDQLAGSTLTVSQGFVQLQNVLIDVAGKLNESTGAGSALVGVLQRIGEKIEEIANSPSFDNFLEDFIKEGESRLGTMFEQDAKDLQRIGAAISAVGDEFRRVTDPIMQTADAAGLAEQALVNFAQVNGGDFTSEVEGAFRDFINQIIEGHGDIDSAREAIQAMGTADPNFDRVIGKVDILVSTFIRLRDAANAALGAASAVSVAGTPQTFAGQDRGAPRNVAPKPRITLGDYPVIGGGGKGRGGGGGKSPSEKFDDSLQKIKDQTAALGLEQAALNETTFASERARVAQDLLNEARDAGVKITPAVTASIDATAEAYAKAAQSLEQTKKLQEAFTDAATGALTGFISDLREGKSAAEALGNVFDNLADQLINMAAQGLVQAAFGGLFGGGGGGGIGSFFSGLFGGGRASGGPVSAGKAYMVGENGPEPFIPNVGGTIIPRHAMSTGGGDATRIVLEVSEGAAFSTRVLEVSGPQSVQVTRAGLTSYDQSAPGRSADQDMRYR